MNGRYCTFYMFYLEIIRKFRATCIAWIHCNEDTTSWLQDQFSSLENELDPLLPTRWVDKHALIKFDVEKKTRNKINRDNLKCNGLLKMRLT